MQFIVDKGTVHGAMLLHGIIPDIAEMNAKRLAKFAKTAGAKESSKL